MPKKKTAPKKTPKEKKQPKKSVKRPASGRGSGKMGGARRTEVDILLSESVDEVEAYFNGRHDQETFVDGKCTIAELKFCAAYISSNYKLGPSILSAFPETEKLTSCARIAKATKYLNSLNVQEYLAQELYNHQVASGVTFKWVTKKYKEWAEIDPTQYFDLVKLGDAKRYSIVLKCELSKLPKHVRTAIKGLSVDPKTGSIKVDLIDSKGAMDSLVKLMGFTNEHLKIDLNDVHIHFDSQDEDA